jgi:hypothetical protein
VKGGYERKRVYGRGDYHSTWIFGGGLSWIWEFAGESLSWGVGQRISTGGTGLLGVLGTGARISIWYPGARKLS